jgi:hypothetical protein
VAKFPWGSWLRFAMLHQVRLVGWSALDQAPGPDFHYHKLNADSLESIARPYLEDAPLDKDACQIVSWDDGM